MSVTGATTEQPKHFTLLSPKMSRLRAVCLSLVGAVSLVIIIMIVKDGGRLSSAPPRPREVVVEHRYIHVGSNATSTTAGAPWIYDWDKRAPTKSVTGNQVPVQRRLFLVRHGKYDFKTGHLNRIGTEQAHYTGQRLRDMGLKFALITHSTMVRAVETARIISTHVQNVSMVADDLLQEGGPVPPKPTVAYWSLPAKIYHVDGPRMESAFRKYIHRPGEQQHADSVEIIVGHGNIFRFFVLRALQLPPEAWMRVFIAHGSITELNINHMGIVSMTLFGDSGHIPTDRITY